VDPEPLVGLCFPGDIVIAEDQVDAFKKKVDRFLHALGEVVTPLAQQKQLRSDIQRCEDYVIPLNRGGVTTCDFVKLLIDKVSDGLKMPRRPLTPEGVATADDLNFDDLHLHPVLVFAKAQVRVHPGEFHSGTIEPTCNSVNQQEGATNLTLGRRGAFRFISRDTSFFVLRRFGGRVTSTPEPAGFTSK
jgi:hypothetical protein